MLLFLFLNESVINLLILKHIVDVNEAISYLNHIFNLYQLSCATT